MSIVKCWFIFHDWVFYARTYDILSRYTRFVYQCQRPGCKAFKTREVHGKIVELSSQASADELERSIKP
jgi:hypothetical protein